MAPVNSVGCEIISCRVPVAEVTCARLELICGSLIHALKGSILFSQVLPRHTRSTHLKCVEYRQPAGNVIKSLAVAACGERNQSRPLLCHTGLLLHQQKPLWLLPKGAWLWLGLSLGPLHVDEDSASHVRAHTGLTEVLGPQW